MIGEAAQTMDHWDQEMLDVTYDWAIRTHLRASDNVRVPVPPRPEFFK